MIYKKLIKDRINDTAFIEVCMQAKSMAEAAALLNLHFNSFKKEHWNLDATNQIRQVLEPGKILLKSPYQILLKRGFIHIISLIN